MKKLFVLAVALVIMPVSSMALAPNLVNYQGRLTDGSGNPVADNSYSVQFALYDVSAGGSPLWSETLNVSTVSGLFTVLLGSVTPFDPTLFSDSIRWLGIKVGADAELSPRTRIASVPFALHAAGGSGWVDDGSVVRLENGTDRVGIGTSAPSHPLTVVEPNDGLFVSRMESRNTLATVTEISNTSVPATWEISVSGSDGAFGGDIDPGALYFYRQASPGVAMVIDSANRVFMGHPGFGTISRLYVENNLSGFNRGLEVRATGAGSNTGVLSEIAYGTGGYAVLGEGGSQGYGGFFNGRRAVSGSGEEVGIEGYATSATSFSCVATSGQAQHTGGQASYGVTGYGVGNGTNYGLYGSAFGGTTNWAGWFEGNTHVNGTLSKSAGSFRIDHPLDPENRYLQHSFVESPDMMNVYNGNAILDANGEAVVTLPSYFEALNKDFRYQLTCVGGFAPVYVATKVAGNSFSIAGGTPGLEVSWQVTGVRKDPYAEANRIQVEPLKPSADIGKYEHPLAYGKPIETGIDYAMRQNLRASGHLKTTEERNQEHKALTGE